MATLLTLTQKPEPIWRAKIGDCTIEAYDFKLLKINQEIRPGESPALLDFPTKKESR